MSQAINGDENSVSASMEDTARSDTDDINELNDRIDEL